ncbi:MAG: hypothetical protein ACUVQP_01850 [Bacteroidales bacterium]
MFKEFFKEGEKEVNIIGGNFLKIDVGLILIEGIVIFSLILLLIYVIKEKRIKQIKKDFLDLEPLIKWIKEGENLCEKFQKFMKSKEFFQSKSFNRIDIGNKLDPKISKLNQFLEVAPYHYKGLEGEVKKMVEAGYNISEIANSLKISPGEVRFLFDWMKYKQSLKGKSESLISNRNFNET